jgi:adenylate cyclase
MRSGIVLPLATPLLYLGVTSVLLLSYGYFVESRRKRRLSRIFSQYVPPEIVQQLDVAEADVSLEGDSREMSVLFSDVRGFTTLSEGLSPRELTRLMNEMLTPLTEVIHRQRGTMDKYMGDAIMAFWGAPLQDAEHARHAVLAALEMIACTARIRDEFAARGWPPLHIGVGVSTGPMNVGNMGSEFRVAYTVLGDTVNLGSRLEGLTKQYGVDIIVSRATVQAIPDMAFRELDTVRVKGKNEPVAIYEPLGLRSALDGVRVARMEQFHEALQRYRTRQFGTALRLLDGLAQEKDESLIALYRDRVTHFLDQPPPPEWDGVYVHKNK